ncbi:MAG: nuclear transport factor 2 family protein [Ktedonobacteraceae bacterium]|nr:nuclear transport factor 2 family protein [Ktedonobacteraceae bacterium]
MSQEHTEQEITRLIDAWNAAELRADAAFIAKTLADDFIGIGPLGFMLSKQQWLQRHQSGEMKYSALNLSEVKVRLYDQAAIVICRQDQQASYRGNPINAQLRTTLVFVDQQGEWRLAGLHYCNIGQPPSFARS